jgi:hypothetical protein
MRAAEARPAMLARERRSRAVAAVRARALTAEGGAAALLVAFLGIAVWWVSVDTRVVNADTARHLQLAFDLDRDIRAGDLGAFLTQSSVYPPLVHLVGAVSTLVGGFGVRGPILAQDLVFVPLLVLGCFGAARVVAGPGAGLLAAVFALGAPIVISQSHVYMLDLPLAALTATTVWLVLASERFARRGYAVAAGATIALGLLTKPSFVLFVIGMLVVVLLRGGWRHPRNVALFAAFPAALAAPWYLDHLGTVDWSINAALHGVAGAATGAHREVWSVRNFGWYGWAMVNVQLLLPLTLLFGVGLVESLVRFVRDRRGDDYTPELVAGAAVGWILVSITLFQDVRYTLPGLVYVAVIGTTWIVRSPPRVRLAATAALLAVFATNTAMVNLHLGEPVRVAFPYSIDRGVRERQLTFVSSAGFIVNEPTRGQRVLELLRAAHRDGARQVYFDGPSTARPPFEAGGLGVFARMVGLGNPPYNDPRRLGAKDIVVLRRPPLPGPPPCTLLADGTAVYLLRGYPRPPFERQRYCPPGFGGTS